jgi:predicted metal-dependent HD superfamily phosphohydrolase
MADLKRAKHFILSELEERLPEYLSYHDLGHTLYVHKIACMLAEEFSLNEEDRLRLETAALYHDCGFLNTYREHEEAGCLTAREVLPGFGYSEAQIEQICEIILATTVPQNPKNFLSELLCDADLHYLGGTEYDFIAGNLYKEFQVQQIVQSEDSWYKMQIGFLENHRFFNPYSKQHCEPGKQRNLERIKADYARFLSA